MNKRGVIITSTLFGLFALFFGVLGVRALTLGPDPARPTAAEMSARTAAADRMERQIAATRADTPPDLPAVPERISMPATAVPAPVQRAAATSTPAPAAAARAPSREWDDDDHEDDHGHDGDHDEDHDDDHEEGDADDD
jgi:hypothetical protein